MRKVKDSLGNAYRTAGRGVEYAVLDWPTPKRVALLWVGALAIAILDMLLR